MKRLSSLLKLTRVEHGSMLLIAILTAEIVSVGGLPSASILVLSLIAPFFVSMGAFAINDYFDVEADRANKRHRPLVTGEMAPDEALYITAVSFLVAAIAGYLLSIYELAIVVFFSLASVLYSYRLKTMLFWGNAYISASAAIPFFFGAYAVTNQANAAILVLAAIGFLGNFAREIGGTIKDYAGDLGVRNAKTIPIVFGRRAAAFVGLVLYIAAIALSIYAFLYVAPFRLNLVYGIPILIVDAALLYAGAGYLVYRSRGFYDLARNVSLAAMALALVAFLLAAIFNVPF